jgi:hypothetical protein
MITVIINNYIMWRKTASPARQPIASGKHKLDRLITSAAATTVAAYPCSTNARAWE